jgi:hypothetical protein
MIARNKLSIELTVLKPDVPYAVIKSSDDSISRVNVLGMTSIQPGQTAPKEHL